jgi:hypothetical protein
MLLLPALPARADVLDCLEFAAAPFIQATKAGGFAFDNPNCATKAADPTSGGGTNPKLHHRPDPTGV